MVRIAVVLLLLAGVVLAPAAAAEERTAVLSEPHDLVAGAPWTTTAKLNDFRDAPPEPLLIGYRSDGHVDAEVRGVRYSSEGALTFKTTMVFPFAGRWRLMLVAGSHRYRFPALEVSAPATHVERAGDGGGLPLWLLPLVGVMLAGFGAAAVRRRG